MSGSCSHGPTRPISLKSSFFSWKIVFICNECKWQKSFFFIDFSKYRLITNCWNSLPMLFKLFLRKDYCYHISPLSITAAFCDAYLFTFRKSGPAKCSWILALSDILLVWWQWDTCYKMYRRALIVCGPDWMAWLLLMGCQLHNSGLQANTE